MPIALFTLTMMMAIPSLAVVPAAKPADDPTAEIIAMEKAMLDRSGNRRYGQLPRIGRPGDHLFRSEPG